MTVAEVVLEHVAEHVVVGLSDAGEGWGGEVETLGVGLIIHPLHREDAGLARLGATQGGGAGEGEAQHARMGEEVEESLYVPAVPPRFLNHLC